MAIKIQGTTVVDDTRQLQNIVSLDTNTANTIEATIRETSTSPTISAGTLTLDLNASNVFDVSLNANITTLTISNVVAAGSVSYFILIFTADGTLRSVTWPTSFRWSDSTAPTLTSASGKRDVIVAFTEDAGTNWYAFVSGQGIG